MHKCRDCQTEIPEESIITSLSGFVQFYQCPGCNLWTEQINGSSEKGNAPTICRLYKVPPFDLVTNDIAIPLDAMLAGTPDKLSPSARTKVAKFIQATVLRYMTEFAKSMGADERGTENYFIGMGLYPTRPYKEFSGAQDVNKIEQS